MPNIIPNFPNIIQTVGSDSLYIDYTSADCYWERENVDKYSASRKSSLCEGRCVLPSAVIPRQGGADEGRARDGFSVSLAWRVCGSGMHFS